MLVQARLSLLSEQDLRLLLFYIVTIDPSAIVQLLRPISSLVGVPSGDAQYSMVCCLLCAINVARELTSAAASLANVPSKSNPFVVMTALIRASAIQLARRGLQARLLCSQMRSGVHM